MAANERYAGNTQRVKPKKIEALSYKVIDAFTGFIVDRGLADKVTLILDADRQDIYADTRTESYFNRMRAHLVTSAMDAGIRLIDMDGVFRDDYAANQVRFEFPTDGHWNEHAHRLVAETYLRQRKGE